jgi:hypothetical protein
MTNLLFGRFEEVEEIHLHVLLRFAHNLIDCLVNYFFEFTWIDQYLP